MASVKLKHTSGNGTILHSPAANPSSDVTLKLPSTTGSAGQVLKVASANHSSTNAELEFGADASGKILQVVQVVKTDTFTHTGQTFVDLPSFNPSITPTSTGSKIMLDISLSGNASGQGAIDLYRSIGGGTYAQLTDFIGDAASNAYRTTMSFGGQESTARENIGLKILDTPTYSSGQAIAYKLKVGSPYISSYKIHINQVDYIYNSANYDKTTICTFTLSEVAA